MLKVLSQFIEVITVCIHHLKYFLHLINVFY